MAKNFLLASVFFYVHIGGSVAQTKRRVVVCDDPNLDTSQFALNAGEAIELAIDAPTGECSFELRGRKGDQNAPIAGLLTFLRVVNEEGCDADINVNVTGVLPRPSWIGGNRTYYEEKLIANYSSKSDACNAAISKYSNNVFDYIAIAIRVPIRRKDFHGLLTVQLTFTVPLPKSSNKLKHFCSTEVTIDYALVCDSYFNCPSGSDEQLCNLAGEDALLRGQVFTGIGACVAAIFTLVGLRYLIHRYHRRSHMHSETSTNRNRGRSTNNNDARVVVTRSATNAERSSRLAQAQLQPLLQPQPASRSTATAPTALANQRGRLLSEDAPPTYEEAVLSVPTQQT